MNILNKIISYKKAEVVKQKNDLSLNFAEFEEICKKLPPVKSFEAMLKNNKDINKMSLIAEVKKASPSRGIIKEDFDPLNIALEYKNAGASAVSVLTDEKFFLGSVEYLKIIKKHINLPVLRKDFIIDPFQVYQTRFIGADIILLIVAALNNAELKDLYHLSKELGLEVLVEVHDSHELEQALDLKAKIIGINNRNLEDFSVSINTTIDLVKEADISNTFIISESGIKDNSDVSILKNVGVSGILVGESLIIQENIQKAVFDLMKNF